MGSQNVVNIDSDSALRAAVEAAPALLLDVWAPWCGPCRLMAPVMEEMADRYGERLVVAKFKALDDDPTVERLEVKGLPTLILYIKAEEVARHEGVLTRQQMQIMVDSWL
ncbi:MAG: thioredoxin family protein [Cyanobacteriota bacterium]|jgi:thiol-disulfide isomerase/thioredoxin